MTAISNFTSQPKGMEVKKSITDLSTKKISSYDKDQNGKIDGNEITIFKTDCKKLYKEVYGEESSQYKTLENVLDKSELKFDMLPHAGHVNRKESDFENKKYFVHLSNTPNGESLKDSSITFGSYAGTVIHELEHVQQLQKDYEMYKAKYDGNTKKAKRAIKNKRPSDRYELYADMEMMYFFSKIKKFDKGKEPEIYKNFVGQMEKIGADPIQNREKFVKNFDEQSFLGIIKDPSYYPDFNFQYKSDKEDKNNLKDLLF